MKTYRIMKRKWKDQWSLTSRGENVVACIKTSSITDGTFS